MRADRVGLSKAGNGRPPVGVERMLRIYFLQQWFNLSDPAAEEALYDSAVMRSFVGIDLGREPVPDETTVRKFRHLLEEHRLGEKMLETVNLYLGGQRGADYDGHDRGCDHHPRTQFDEEPRAAARPGDADQEGQPVVLRDEGPCGRDGRTQMINTLVATAAHVADATDGRARW